MLTKKCNKVWKGSDRVSVAVKDGRCYIVNDYVGVTFPAAEIWWNEYARPGLLCNMPEEDTGFIIRKGDKAPDPDLSAASVWDSCTGKAEDRATYTPISCDVQLDSFKPKKTLLRVFVAHGKPIFINQQYADMFDVENCSDILCCKEHGSRSPVELWLNADRRVGAVVMPHLPPENWYDAISALTAHATRGGTDDV